MILHPLLLLHRLAIFATSLPRRAFNHQFVPFNKLLFYQQIVMGGNRVVPISMQTLFHVARLHIRRQTLLHFHNHVLVDFSLIDTDLAPQAGNVDGYGVRIFKPGVRRYLFQTVTKFGVRHQNVFNQITNFTAQITGEFVVGAEDLLVEALGVIVLEGQVTAHEGVEDDACGP